MTREDLEDLLSDAIDDSIDMDWTGRCGARAIIRRLEDAKQLDKVLSILPDYMDEVWDD